MNTKKILKCSSLLAIIIGIVMVLGGIWGLYFTYKNVAQENIVTPEDASISKTPVRGPLTLKSQADVIRKHTLRITNNKTYSEMPRQIQKLDENGNVVLDNEGKPIMIPNNARNIWITATSLTTALNLGILAYIFSISVVLFGLVSFWTGIALYLIGKKYE